MLFITYRKKQNQEKTEVKLFSIRRPCSVLSKPAHSISADTEEAAHHKDTCYGCRLTS